MTEHVVATFRASTRRWLFGSFAGWMTLALCFVGIGFLMILGRWLHDVGTQYELTNQRLIIRTGILIKRIDEIELYRVRDVKVDYSLLNQLADIGTISILSSDATTRGGTYQLVGVPSAVALREEMRTLVDEARRRRRVREIDVDYDDMR